jgi:hypothetical protein
MNTDMTQYMLRFYLCDVWEQTINLKWLKSVRLLLLGWECSGARRFPGGGGNASWWCPADISLSKNHQVLWSPESKRQFHQLKKKEFLNFQLDLKKISKFWYLSILLYRKNFSMKLILFKKEFRFCVNHFSVTITKCLRSSTCKEKSFIFGL